MNIYVTYHAHSFFPLYFSFYNPLASTILLLSRKLTLTMYTSFPFSSSLPSHHMRQSLQCTLQFHILLTHLYHFFIYVFHPLPHSCILPIGRISTLFYTSFLSHSDHSGSSVTYILIPFLSSPHMHILPNSSHFSDSPDTHIDVSFQSSTHALYMSLYT